MEAELAGANVNRAYSLAATSIAIFTFTLFFGYPKYIGGEADPLLFQATLVTMGLATFSFVFASLHYYSASAGSRMGAAERTLHSRRGDGSWLLGYTLLFLAPSLILLSVRLAVVGAVWLALWAVYLGFVIRHFPRMRTA